MKKKNPDTTTKKAGGIGSIILKTLLALLVLYALGQITVNRIKIAQAQKSVNSLSSEADLAQRTLEKTEKAAEGDPDSEDLLEIARDSGYILPGERVFEDANAK